jgi:DNA-binding response OmpR family regulator
VRCREVRRRWPRRVLPAIFISANCCTEHIVDGLAAGAHDYMAKPVNRDELVARVRAQLRARDAVRSRLPVPHRALDVLANGVHSANLLPGEHVVGKEERTTRAWGCA